jgi:hypothetical protein
MSVKLGFTIVLGFAVALSQLYGCLYGGPEPCEHVWPLFCTSEDGACHYIAAAGNDDAEARRHSERICDDLGGQPTDEDCRAGPRCERSADHACGPDRFETTYPGFTEAAGRDACLKACGEYIPPP